MRTPSWRPAPTSPDPYSIYLLRGLDGVLAYVALHGETVGYAFGVDERSAGEAVAAQLRQPAPRTPSGAEARAREA